MADFRIMNHGAFASLEIRLRKGTTMKAESDALITCSGGIDIGGRLDGGWIPALIRSFTGSQSSLFTQTITSQRDDENAVLAPRLPGDIRLLTIGGGGGSSGERGVNSYLIQRGCFLACEDTVILNTQIQSDVFKGLFGGQGFFLLSASGIGRIALSSFGSILSYTLREGEIRLVDNGHIVAFDGHMRYEIVQASRGLLNTVTSGEGFMCRFIGPGTIYIQSHNDENLYSGDIGGNGERRGGGGPHWKGRANGLFCIPLCCFFIFFLMFIAIVVGAAVLGNDGWQMNMNTDNLLGTSNNYHQQTRNNRGPR